MLSAAAVKGPEQTSYYVRIAAAKEAEYYASGANLSTTWLGQGASVLGLSGEVGRAELAELCLGHHPRSGAPLGRAYLESSGKRSSARCWDLTFSAPKAVSVLWAAAASAGRAEVAGEIEAAMVASAREVVAEVEQTYATTRVGPAGAQRWVATEAVAAAAFLQADSRSLDPQLHVHVVVSTKVPRPDGKWGALHPTLLLKHREALGRLGEACLAAELRHRLGVRADQEARVASVPAELCRAFSTRTVEIKGRYSSLVDAFRSAEGRDPSREEAWRLRNQATIETRRAKPDHRTVAEGVLARARGVFAELAIAPDDVVRSCLGQGALGQRPSVEAVAEAALEAVATTRSTWHRQDVAKEAALALPATWAASAEEVRSFVTEATEAAMGQCLLLEKGRRPRPYGADPASPARAPHARLVTTEALLKEAAMLSSWGEKARALAPSEGARRRASDGGADPLQAEAAAAIAGRAPLALVVGPPGTGKTAVLEAAVAELGREGRPVLLSAVSHQARQEMEAATGHSALTLEALRQRVTRGDLVTPPRTTVIVDEASMVPTPDLAWLAHWTTEAGHRVALVGDPRQLSAVGRGGAFSDLTEENRRATVVLAQAWRFRDRAEARAARALREGSSQALAWYQSEGRAVAVASAELDAQAEVVAECWAKARAAGRVGVFVDTNEQAKAANTAIQQTRLSAGELRAELGAGSGRGGAVVLVGDEVVLRDAGDGRALRTEAGAGVYNRDRGEVTGVGPHGGLVVAWGDKGTTVLSASQAAERVELAYAVTCHGGQGVTVGGPQETGTGIYWASRAGDGRALLVGMTRGRDRNVVVGHAASEEELVAELADQLGRNRADRSPRSVLRDGPEPLRTPSHRRPPTAQRLREAWTERDALAELVAEARRAEAVAARVETASHPAQGSAGARTHARHSAAKERIGKAEGRAAEGGSVPAGTAKPTTSWEESHQRQLERLEGLSKEIAHLSRARARELCVSPPDYLLQALGGPSGPKDARWLRATAEIESYRARWAVGERSFALPPPNDLSRRHHGAVSELVSDLGFSRTPSCQGIEAMGRQRG